MISLISNQKDFSSLQHLEAVGGSVYEKVIINNFEKFTGRHVCQSLF